MRPVGGDRLSSVEINKRVVRRLIEEAVNTGDVDVLAELIAAMWREPITRGGSAVA